MRRVWTPDRAIAWERDARMVRLGKQFAQLGGVYMSPDNPGASPPPPPPASNPPFSTVKSLAHFDDNNPCDDFVLGTGLWTGYTQGASLGVFGTGGMLLDVGGASVGCTLASGTTIALGAGEFLVEGWARARALSGVLMYWDNRVFSSLGGGGTDSHINFYWDTSANCWKVNVGTSTIITGSSGVGTPSTSAYQHLALCRDSGNTVRFYAGGTLIGSASDSTNFTASNVGIGTSYASSQRNLSRVDEWRIAAGAGAGVYTGSSLTVPTSTFPNS